MVVARPFDILCLYLLVLSHIRDCRAGARRDPTRLWQLCEPAVSAAWRARCVGVALWLAVADLSGAGVNPVAQLSVWLGWIFRRLFDGRLLWRVLRGVQLLGLCAFRNGPAAAQDAAGPLARRDAGGRGGLCAQLCGDDVLLWK